MDHCEVLAQRIPITQQEWEAVKKNRPFYFKGWFLLQAPVFEFSKTAWVWARQVS